MEKRTNWWMVIAIVSITLLLFKGIGYGWRGCGSYSGYGGMMSWMWGNPFGWFLGFAAMIAIWALAIIILIYFIRKIGGSLNQQKSSGGKNAKGKNR